MKQKYFTLIELLIVVAIISILMSLLLPALNNAKYQAKKILTVANSGQIIKGFLMYANDYATLPVCPYPDNLEGREHSGYMDTRYSIFFDFRIVAKEYNFEPSTGHPVLDAPTWGNPANSNTTYLMSPWTYYASSPVKVSLYPEVLSSYRLNKATPNSIMFMDYLKVSDTGVVQSSHAYQDERYIVNSGNPSWCFFSGNYPKGAVGGNYDGSSRFVKFNNLKFWLRNNGWKHYYIPKE